MGTSSKHHYIPQFFLKGFTNETGQFYIYDKKADLVRKRSFSPSSYFHKENRNTITINGISDDAPEQLFGISENRDKLIVQYIQKQEGVLVLSLKQIVDLQYFLSNLFFRLPAVDSIYERFMKESNVIGNFYKFKDSSGNSIPQELLDNFKKDPVMHKALRSAFGSFVLINSKSLTDHENWEFVYRPDGFHLLSDNPLIFEDLKTLDFFENPFVIPLSGKYKLVRFKKPISKNTLSENFSLASEVLMVHQAKEYVCCASKEFLQYIVDASKKFNIEMCRQMLFVNKLN